MSLFLRSFGRFFLLLLFVLTLPTSAFTASKERVLYSFGSGSNDGKFPLGGLILDKAGNLYGTTSGGGTSGQYGAVFELSPGAGGVWTESVLHSFSLSDGSYPYAGLALDALGNLYGTTEQGGIYNNGVVFELSPQSGGGWSYTVLHNFSGVPDGSEPDAPVALDRAGNLYGTTYQGGSTGCGSGYGCGVVFKLAHSGQSWTETILYTFKGGADGAFPQASLTADSSGTLYSTFSLGGTFDDGGVFSLTPNPDGTWSEAVLYSFGSVNRDGAFPDGTVKFDKSGNLYTTTSFGGASAAGTVVELSPSVGSWSESIIYQVPGNGDAVPSSGLVWDSAGNLYGTTCGCFHGNGGVLELTPQTGGGWTGQFIHSFSGGSDGVSPENGVVMDRKGNLYGITELGGANNAGVVFEVRP